MLRFESKHSACLVRIDHAGIYGQDAANLDAISKIILNQLNRRFTEARDGLGKQQCFLATQIGFQGTRSAPATSYPSSISGKARRTAGPTSAAFEGVRE